MIIKGWPACAPQAPLFTAGSFIAVMERTKTKTRKPLFSYRLSVIHVKIMARNRAGRSERLQGTLSLRPQEA